MVDGYHSKVTVALLEPPIERPQRYFLSLTFTASATTLIPSTNRLSPSTPNRTLFAPIVTSPCGLLPRLLLVHGRLEGVMKAVERGAVKKHHPLKRREAAPPLIAGLYTKTSGAQAS